VRRWDSLGDRGESEASWWGTWEIATAAGPDMSRAGTSGGVSSGETGL
jgi:hypothetical protein